MTLYSSFLRSAVIGLVTGCLSLPGQVAVAEDSARPPGGGPTSAVEIGFMNGLHEDLDSNLQPIRQGGITIRVSSPDHRLTVHGNRLTLTPRSDGALDARMEVDFEGRGRLIADVETLGRFEDRVQAPRQTARAGGRVRLMRAAGRYVFTIEEADRFVGLEINSGVARQVVGACRIFAILMNLPCDGIERSLSVVNVPMPGPGEQLAVPAELLSDQERAFLDRFVADE